MLRCLKFADTLMVVFFLIVSAGALYGQADHQQQLRDRYLSSALNSPRQGITTEKLYQLSLQLGDIDQVLTDLESQASAANNANAWTLLALIRQQRGHDAEAIAALDKAIEADSSNGYPRYLLGTLHLNRNSYEKAIEQLGRALEQELSPEDEVAARKALGRAYVRSRQFDQAKEVWATLVKMTPNDPLTLKELTALLIEEEQWEEALTYFETLRELQKNEPYELVLIDAAMAGVEARRGHFQDALKRYEQALERVKADSWLAADIRMRIEELFRKRNDLSGLVSYYENALSENESPDVQTVIALADLLVELDRGEEGQKRYTQALEVTPTDQQVRLAYIDVLLLNKEYEKAIEQYATLIEQRPDETAYLETLGALHLDAADEADSEEAQVRKDAQEKAREMWDKIAELSPNDPATMVRVAELFRGYDMLEDAEEYYKKAVELAPGLGQYREYYGEFLVKNDRTDEAIEVFKQIASGERRSTETLMRLADVLSYFDFNEQALETSREAVETAPDSFDARMQLVNLLADTDDFDAALKELDVAEEYAPNEFFASDVVDRRIRLLRRAERLETAYLEHTDELRKTDAVDVPACIEASKMAMALQRRQEAVDWIHKAIDGSGKAVPVLELAASIYEHAGDWQRSTETLEQLIELAPQNRRDYYRQLATQYSALGERDRAIENAEQLIKTVPDDPDAHALLARLCERFGMADRSLESLAQALKVAPKNVELRMQYAERMERDGQYDTAIEQYWIAFDAGEDVDEKLGVMRKLAEASYKATRFDMLIDRLERRRRVTQDDWVPTICMAEAYRQIEDLNRARDLLGTLLSQRPDDVQLVKQLARISERQGLSDQTLAHMRQLVELEPSRHNLMKLAELQQEAGETDAALETYNQAIESADDKPAVIRTVAEKLMVHEQNEVVGELLEQAVKDSPDAWELQWLLGEWLRNQERLDEASAVYLELANRAPLPETKEKKKQTSRHAHPMLASLPPAFQRMQMTVSMRYQLSPQYQQHNRRQFMPPDADLARSAAWYRYCQIAKEQDRYGQLVAELKEKNTVASWQRLVETYAMEEQRGEEFSEALDKLIALAPDNKEAKLYRLMLLMDHHLRQSAEVDIDQMEGELDALIEDEPQLKVMVTAGWIQYLEHKGHTDRATEVAKRLAEMELTEQWEFMYAIQTLSHANQLDAVLKLLEDAKTQTASAGGNPMQNSWMYLSIIQVAMKNDRPDVAADMLLRFLEQSRPSATQIVTPAGTFHSMFSGQRSAGLSFPNTSVYYDRQRLQILERFSRLAQESGGESGSIGLILPSATTSGTPSAATQPSEASTNGSQNSAMQRVREAFAHDIERGNEEDRIFAHLGLAYLDWWADEKNSAADHLESTLDLRPDDLSLRFTLALVRAGLDQKEEALDVLKSMHQRYHALYKPTQQLMLQLAKATDREELAKTAALRLFNMRLNTSEQLDLVATMRQLGLSDKAELLEKRVKAVSQQDMNSLYQLMQSKRERNELDEAAELAQQILRNLDKTPTGNRDHYRRNSLEILGQAGKLDRLILATEKQIEQNPKAARLLKDLWHYYSAKGNNEKAIDAARRAIQLVPGDYGLRFQYATSLQQVGRSDEAIQEFMTIVENDPIQFFDGHGMHGIARMFTQSGRLDDLARVLAEADLEKTASKLGHNTHQMTWQLQNLIEQVVRYSEGSLPDWLSDWDDTGQVIVAGSGSDSAFRLFKKCMPAGQVTLGANQAEGAKNAGRHYFVLVEPTSKHQEGKMAFEDPVPGDGTAGISLNADLSWSGLSDIDDYEIHFGTTSEPPFVIQHQKRMYDPGPLDPETTYYWQIVANVDGAKHAGPVWSFTTASGEPRPEREVYCDLDAVNRGWGLELRSTEDGDTAATSIGGRRCRTNLDPETDHHMYFNVASWYADGGARPQLYVSVLYYDTGEGYLELTYNSRRNYYEKAGHVEMTGSDTWKEHTFKLEEIWFHGGQNGNSDLRISGGAGQPIYVDVVRVSDVSFEPALMGSFVADRHSGPAPHAVQFDARGSVHTGKVDIADYAWDFGDGQQASGPEVQHTYEQPGMYETTLTVTDDEGTVARASLQIDVGCFVSVSNLNRYSIGRLYTGGHYLNDRDYTITTMPPFLERSQGILPANGDKEAREAEWITFELADPCDVYVAYDPRIGMPPAWLDSFEKTEHVIELSDGAQDHAVLYRRRFAAGPVTLGSNYGNTSSSHYFLLFAPDCGDQPRPLRPLAAFDLDIERGVAPLEVQFDAGASSDPMGEGIVQYEWDFGDTTSDGAVTSHTFEKPGVFTVTLSVTDAEGLTAHAQLDIEVMSRAIVLHNPNRYGIQQFFPGLPIDDSGHPTIEQMPGHLYGTIGIVPSREDAERTESEWLTFELGQPADVYVAYDSRAVPCRNALPLVDNYLKALTKINHSSHYKSEAVELKTKLLRNAGRMQDALRFLLGSCKTWDQYEPIFGPTQETAADNPPVSPPRPVDLLTNITSYRGTDWTPNGPVSTLLDVAGEMSQLEPMLAFLEARLEQTDEDRKRFTHNVWKTMLLARLERYENAKEVIRKILDRHSTNEKSGRLPYQPLLWLDSEIHDKPELIEESLECCKLAAEGYKEASRRNSSGLMYRLAMRQADAGRRDAARDTFLRLATLSVESHHDSAYAEYQRQQHLHHAASGLAEIEFHREAYALASRFHHMDRPQNWGDHYLNRGKQLANKLAEEHPELKYHLTLAATPVGEDEIELVWSITREQWRHWNNETQFMPIRESESWLDGLKAEIQVSHWFNGSFRSIETVDASKQRHVVSAVKPNTLFLYRIVLKTEDNRIGFVSDLAVGVAGENLLAGDFETSPEGWYFSTAYRLEKTDPGPNRHAGRQPTARPLATGSQAMQIATGEEAVWASPAIETDSGQSYYIGGWVKLETGGGRVEMGRLALDSEDRPMMYSALTSDDRPGGWVYVNQRIHPADADLSYEDGPVIAKDTEADRIPKAQSSMRLQLLLDETEVLLDDLFVVAYERGEASLLDALPSAEKPLIDMTLFLDLIDRWSKLDNLDPGLAKAEDEKQSAESEDGS